MRHHQKREEAERKRIKEKVWLKDRQIFTILLGGGTKEEGGI